MRVARKIPELFLGALLAVAIFAIGATFSYSVEAPVNQPQQAQSQQAADYSGTKVAIEENSNWFSWVTNSKLWIFTLITAVAAVGLWYVAVRTARRQLRAYVSFIGPAFRIARVGDNQTIVISVEARMKNSGQTPARNCKISIAWLETDADQLMPTATFEEKLTTPIAPVGPGVEFTSRRDRKSLQTITEASFVRKRLYFFVRCDYEDIWGKRRFTKICLRTHPEFRPQNITAQNFDRFQMSWSCPTWGDYSGDT